MYSTVLVPLDGSELSEKALLPAKDLARRYGASLVLLRARSFPERSYGPPDYLAPSMVDWLEEEEAAIDGYLDAWRQKIEAEGIPCRTSSWMEGATEAIVAEARACGADLIVMSSHGRTGMDRWLHGSVAVKVLRRAPCPILMIRALPVPGEEEPAGLEAAAASS